MFKSVPCNGTVFLNVTFTLLIDYFRHTSYCIILSMTFRQEITCSGLQSVKEIVNSTQRSEKFINCLLKKNEDGLYRQAGTDEQCKKGDSLIIYSVDPSSTSELQACNSLFNDHYYGKKEVAQEQKLWPDEDLFIKNFIPNSNSSLLEICCGNGRITPYLCKDGNSVVGLDFSKDSITLAKENTSDKLEFVYGDAFELPFDTEEFDVSVCFENSLGIFFEDEEKIIEELITVTSKKVLLGLRNVDDSDEFLHYYVSPDGYIEFATVFTEKRLESILEKISDNLKARIDSVDYYPGLPRPWGGTQFYAVLNLNA
ncbi:hypothetical protein DID80_04580 [Candidatus Marinamargulisbacteria bacterium SCGC AAA071-K20]|nr:hypothetical protein DID80_04580 [Candidatus Marinamargulisbacteria bacterium SCGC AAA071-K20]